MKKVFESFQKLSILAVFALLFCLVSANTVMAGAPVIGNPGDLTYTANEYVEIHLLASDADEDYSDAMTMSYTFSGDGSSTFDSTNNFLETSEDNLARCPNGHSCSESYISWTPTEEDIGDHEFTVTAIDDVGESEEISFTVTIEAEKLITFTGELTASQEETFSLTISTSGFGENIEWSGMTVLSDYTFSDNLDDTYTYSWQTDCEDQAGEYPLIFMAKDVDSGEYISEEITLTLSESESCSRTNEGDEPGDTEGDDAEGDNDDTPTGEETPETDNEEVNDAPVFDSVSEQSATMRDPFSLEFTVSDPDGDSISIDSADVSCSDCSSDSSLDLTEGVNLAFDSSTGEISISIGAWTPSENDIGTHTVTIVVSEDSTDELLSSTLTFDIVVLNEYQEELLDLEAEFEEFEDDFENFEDDYKDAEDDNDQEDLEQAEDDLIDLIDELEKLLEDLKDLENDVDDAEDDEEISSNMEDDLIDEIEDLEDDIEELIDDIESLLGIDNSSSSSSSNSGSSSSSSSSSSGTNTDSGNGEGIQVDVITLSTEEAGNSGEVEKNVESDSLYIAWLIAGLTVCLALFLFLVLFSFAKGRQY